MSEFNERYSYVRLTATGVVKAGSGLLGGFLVVTGTPTITLYDNPSAASGTIIINGLVTVAGTPYPVPAKFTQGCYAVLSGAGDVTFFYE